jgi:hypothetical protein
MNPQPSAKRSLPGFGVADVWRGRWYIQTMWQMSPYFRPTAASGGTRRVGQQRMLWSAVGHQAAVVPREPEICTWWPT